MFDFCTSTNYKQKWRLENEYIVVTDHCCPMFSTPPGGCLTTFSDNNVLAIGPSDGCAGHEHRKKAFYGSFFESRLVNGCYKVDECSKARDDVNLHEKLLDSVTKQRAMQAGDLCERKNKTLCKEWPQVAGKAKGRLELPLVMAEAVLELFSSMRSPIEQDPCLQAWQNST